MTVLSNIKQFAIAMDQCLNVIVFSIARPREKHWADETLSAHAWRMEQQGGPAWPRKAIDHLFFWQDQHCKSAYEAELERVHLPPEMRK